MAGAALAIGTLSAAQAAYDPVPALPALVDRASVTAGQHPDGDQAGAGQGGDQSGSDQGGDRRAPARDAADPGTDLTVHLLAASGLLAVGGIALVGGVIGLGGLRIPGGIAMTVARTRHRIRTMRAAGAHRAR